MLRSLLQTDPSNRRRLFWLMQAFGWSVMAVLPGMVLSQSGVPLAQAALMGAARGVLGLIVSSLLLRPVLRRIWRRGAGFELRWVVPVGLYCLALGWLDMRCTRLLVVRLDLDYSAIPAAVVRASWIFRGTNYHVWTVLYCVIHYWFDTQDARLRLAQLQTERRTVELQQLRAQMNPHFLFNAFNSILAEVDNPRAVTTLTEGMAEYLRFSLRQTDALQRLGDELDALEHYLRVEKVRFEDRFDYAIAASERARQCRVPGALVQPLIENAIKYGRRTSRPPLRLSVAANVTATGELVVDVTNTGRWIPREEPRSGGIGLANLRRRLELLYGPAARCEHGEADGWVRVSLRMPAEVHA